MTTFTRSIVLLTTLAIFVATPAAAFEVQGGIGFVAVSDAPVDAEIVLETAAGVELQRKVADRFGSVIFRDLPQGGVYLVSDAAVLGGAPTPVQGLEFKDHPPASFYQGNTLVGGLNYLETRDGTLLAAMVRPPLGKTMADGPFPTVVEYSGYSPADPLSPQPSTLIAAALGYATVGVNMRGSGCSGGVLDLFDLPTTADGYDIIETVAAQSWVDGNVGMVGISFPGISQLPVAGARPPHLAAIAPFAVIADIYRSPGFPGGIFNNGFAQTWLQDRKNDAEPAPEGGQGWAVRRVNDGDTVCLENQKLRLQTLDPIEFTRDNPFYEADQMDARSPANWVANIGVPIFMSGAWQDEQVGGDFSALLKDLPGGKDVKFTGLNGVHSSPLEPEVLWNWIAFLDIYVAGQIPDPGRAAPFVPLLAIEILGPGAPVPPAPADRFDDITTFAEAKRVFESDPRIRILLENGAGTAEPGLPASTFELGFDRWPPREARKRKWYFGSDGDLVRKRPRRGSSGIDSFQPDPDARPQQTLPGQGQSDSWKIMPDYDWRPLVGGTAVGYITEPLDEDMIVVGPGSVDLWLRSSDADTDLQVTLTEVRPDGLETYVQNGWLRASHRRLGRHKHDRFEPRPTHLERDESPMPAGVFAKVRVGMFGVAHVFRAGSRIRISVEAPGGDRTRWAFDTYATGGTVTNDVARARGLASRIVLPIVRRVSVPPSLPPCPGLRGQPCRTYVPAANGG